MGDITGMPEADRAWMIDTLLALLQTPSPSGRTDAVMQLIGDIFKDFNVPFSLTRRGALTAELPGASKHTDRALVVHADTIGCMVRRLKDNGRLYDLEKRAEAAREMADDPRIDVTCLESVIGTRYTVDTINYLRRRISGLHFVWIMGADNLAQFHRWQNWQRIATQVPMAVIDRPPQSFRALAAPAAQALAPWRVPENQAGRLATYRAPAWVFLTGLKIDLSSTGLRNPDGSWK